MADTDRWPAADGPARADGPAPGRAPANGHVPSNGRGPANGQAENGARRKRVVAREVEVENIESAGLSPQALGHYVPAAEDSAPGVAAAVEPGAIVLSPAGGGASRDDAAREAVPPPALELLSPAERASLILPDGTDRLPDPLADSLVPVGAPPPDGREDSALRPDPLPVVDPTLLASRRRRSSHHRVYRFTQAFTLISAGLSALGLFCTLLDEPGVGRSLIGGAMLAGFLACALSGRTSLSARWRGWAIAAAVFSVAAMALTFVHERVLADDSPPRIERK